MKQIYIKLSKRNTGMIRNATRKKVLASEKKICRSLFSKSKGLMFTFPRSDFGLIFEFRKERIIPITMLFVFYPIDILWLDSKRKVVELNDQAAPFVPTITPERKAKYVIELPAGTIEMTRTKVGDVISF